MEKAIETTDLYAEEVVTNIYETYDRLRQECPVHREPFLSNWIPTRYEDIKAIFHDPESFSSARGVFAVEGGLLGSLLCQDPPRHEKLRQLISKGFTPRAVASREPRIKEILEGLLEQVNGQETFDFVPVVGIPMPVYVLADILAVPAQRYKRFREWSDAFALRIQAGIDTDEVRADIGEMFAYFRDTIADRRVSPGDDLISAMAHAEVDGERLSDDEMLDFCTLLLVAGQETTSGLMVNMMAILAQRPDIWGQVRADRALVDKVIEETLRYEPPAQRLFRTTTHDVTVSGVLIPKGDRIAVNFGAANRDSAHFPNPHSFKLDRSNSHEHLTFGSGIHFCVGAPLARLEAKVLLNTFLDRYRAIAPAEPIQRVAVRPGDPGFLSVPLRVTFA